MMTSSSAQKGKNGHGHPVVAPSKAAIHPDPPKYRPASLYPHADLDSSSDAADCCVILTALSFLILVLVFLEVQEIFDTKKRPEFLVDSIVVSHLNIFGVQLSANWTVGIYMKNRNKHTPIRFENLWVTVLYNKTEFLSKTTVPTFHLPPKNSTTLFVTPSAYLEGLSHSIPERIAKDQRDCHIDFDVILFAKLTFDYPLDRLKGVYKACLVCGDVKVGFPKAGNQGTMVAGPYQCSYTDFLRVHEKD